MSDKLSAVLYGGAVTVDFTPGSHRYKVQGVEYDLIPSVTAVTGMVDKPQLVPWAVKCAVKYIREWVEGNDHRSVTKEDLIALAEAAGKRHEEERKRAADIGSTVHAYAEQFGQCQILGTEPPCIPDDAVSEVIMGMKAFTDWVVKVNPKFVATEQIVCSRRHGYVGIADAVIEVSGKKYLVDYKTSSGIYPEAYLQTAAYQAAWEEQMSEKMAGRFILRFAKDDGTLHERQIMSRDKYVRDFGAFKSLLAAKRSLVKLEADIKATVV
jgi:hypothetical protein